MRAVLQRVRDAAVSSSGQTVAEIGPGLLILVGVGREDSSDDALWLARRTASLRLFDDSSGRMALSLEEGVGDALVVSQFTLLASTKKGARPSFHRAAPQERAEELYLLYAHSLSSLIARPIPTGIFGAMMQVSLTNDGPVTIWLDSRARE